MLKRTAILTLVLGFTLFLGTSSFSPPPDKTCCPNGWELKELKETNPNIVKRDANGDGMLCRKILGEKGDETPKGNNLGEWGPSNYKDNNQPCKD